MARDKRSHYGGVDTSLASDAAYERFTTAAAEAEYEADPHQPDRRRQVRTRSGRLRHFLENLSQPARPTAEQARAALHVAGLVGVEVDPDDPRVVEVLAPPTVLTTDAVLEFLPGMPRPSARALLARMRDEGLITSVGPGQWEIPSAGVMWPSTDRTGAGWVITKRGMLYAIPG